METQVESEFEVQVFYFVSYCSFSVQNSAGAEWAFNNYFLNESVNETTGGPDGQAEQFGINVTVGREPMGDLEQKNLLPVVSEENDLH